MVEVKILAAALVVWGLTHRIQLAWDRMNRDAPSLLPYQLCNAARLLAIGVSAISFLVWVWLHMPTVFRSLCAM